MLPGDEQLTRQRVGAVRRALLRAGVPANRMQVGSFGASPDRQEGDAKALLISSNI